MPGDQLQTIMDGPSPEALAIVWGVIGVVGLVLWLLGRKIARPACSVGGLVTAAAAALGLLHALGAESWVLPVVAVAAVIGGLLAWFLFRLWMGLSCALILAAVAPAALLVWQGTPTAEEAAAARAVEGEPAEAPMLDLEQRDAVGADGKRQLKEDGGWLRLFDFGDAPAAEGEGSAEAPAPPRDAPAAPDADAVRAQVDAATREMVEKAKAAFGAAAQQQAEQVERWWRSLSGRVQGTLMILAMAGASFGLIMGLVAPYFAASLQSSLVGAGFIVAAAKQLTAVYLPEQAGLLPQTPRSIVLVVGLITLAGVVVQCTLWKRRTDK